MEQVIQTFKKTSGEKRIAVLRLEVDYELATLYEALVACDQEKVEECKAKLERYRIELLRLEA